MRTVNRFFGYHSRPLQIGGLLGICLLVFAVSGPTALAQRQVLDKVVAIVDEGVILQSELQQRLASVRQQAGLSNQQLPPEEELRREVLEALVLENLQLQMAGRASIRFDDDTLNRVLSSMAQQNNMSFDEFVAALEEEGTYLQTREQVRRELTLRELQRGLVNRRITITDQEIDNFLDSEMGRSTMAADYLVDHIVVAVSESDSREQINNKLEYASELVARLREGADFAGVRSMAQRDGRYPVSGSNFGWRKQNNLPSLFTDIVPQMVVGDVEGPIRAGNGFHIIKLMQIEGGTSRIVNQTHIRHIMVTPNEIRTDEQAREQIARLRERIQEGEDFATLARQNSDDAASVVAGGDLDWVNAGGMPPAMEDVVNALDVGDLSEPFRTDLGWHIAEVLDRRERDLSQQYSRSQAETALRNRKFDIELQNFLIEIREQAFVEYK